MNLNGEFHQSSRVQWPRDQNLTLALFLWRPNNLHMTHTSRMFEMAET